jgi:addiction module HigA family antidote
MSPKISPPHPGEILLREFMKPMDLTANRLAIELRVTPARIGEIIHGRRSITAETALRLAQFFGTSAELWVNLQARYDLDIAADKLKSKIERKVRRTTGR